jgi:hypothetical protein
MSARSNDDLLQLADHAAWADAAAWTAVLVHPDGAADERIASWLHHLHTVQHAYGLWRGRPAAARPRGRTVRPRIRTDRRQGIRGPAVKARDTRRSLHLPAVERCLAERPRSG